MRKILILAALFLLAACSGNRTPAETAEDFFGYLRAANFAAANNLLVDGETDPMGLLTIEEEFSGMFERLEYFHLTQSPEGDVRRTHIVATGRVNTVYLRKVLREATAEIFPLVLEGGYTEEQLVDMLMAAVLMRVNSPEVPMTETFIEIPMQSVDGTWKIEPNPQFINEVMGGWPDFLDYADGG